MLILFSSCFLQVEKSITFKLIPLSQQNCFLGGTGRDVLSNILHASQLTGWQGGELLSGNIVTWVGVRVQLQPVILPLLITFVKVDFEILMTGTRINGGEIFNCSLILLLFSSWVLHHSHSHVNETIFWKIQHILSTVYWWTAWSSAMARFAVYWGQAIPGTSTNRNYKQKIIASYWILLVFGWVI